MKKFPVIALMLLFSLDASAWIRNQSTWGGNYSGTTWQKPSYCSTKPVTIQTACDLKSYAASPAGSTALSFFQGYVVSTFRTAVHPQDPFCVYVGTDQQAIAAATAYLSTITAQQCAAIPAKDALIKAFTNANLVGCN